ncbi:MAG: ribonuclease [Clostridia bacterium]|nr:ribonuclease [Clostridia bacterium]
MRTKEVGTATDRGFDGADAWLLYRNRLPDYYVTKEEAAVAGWIPRKQNLAEVLPGKQIGGNIYLNKEMKLPQKQGRIWREADFDFVDGYRNSKRILYSNDGLIFVSYDHVQTFYELIN